MVDEWVKKTQKRVNGTYHAVHGYVAITSLLRTPQSLPEEQIKGRIIQRFLSHGRWPGQADPKIGIPASELSHELHDLATAFAGVISSRAGIRHG